MVNAESLLLTSDVARVFNVSAQAVRAWERQGRISAFRTLGGARIFRGCDVLRLQAERSMACEVPSLPSSSAH